jgi:hypothetical protein
MTANRSGETSRLSWVDREPRQSGSVDVVQGPLHVDGGAKSQA